MIRFLALGAALALVPTTALVAKVPMMSAAGYVMKAGAGDQYEIQSSRLVLASTRNPALRSFAGMMVQDHTKSTADVKAAAMRSRLRPAPPRLDAKGAADVAALRRAHGPARDRLYVAQQKAAHAKALALHRGFAMHGGAPALRATAATVVPVVEHHLGELRAM